MSMINCSIQVNVLSTFLLALLLLPLLRKTTNLSTLHPRLVILSSGVHKWTDIPNYRDEENIFKAMNEKDKFLGNDRYPTSKLLDTLLTRELAQRLKTSSHVEDKNISLSGYFLLVSSLNHLGISHSCALLNSSMRVACSPVCVFCVCLCALSYS